MSIIADALKKAQRKGKTGGGAPPPFKLGQAKTAPQAPQSGPAPRAKPVSVKPGAAAPKAVPVVKAKPAARAADPAAAKAAKPAKAKAKAAGKASPLKQRIRRVALMTVPLVIVLAAAYYYVNFIYLPGMKQGGIAAVSPQPQPKKPEPAPAASSENQQAAAKDGKAGNDAAAADKNAAAPAEGKQMNVPPVPQAGPGAAGAGGESAGTSAADLPEYLPDRKDLTDEALPENNYIAPAGEAPSVPTEHPAPGTIVNKGEQRKELREDIYHFNMAVYFQRKGDVHAALREYEEVIRLSPHNAEVFSNMGVLYNQVGEYGNAVTALQKALMIDPNYSKARNNLAVAYYRMGRYDQALEQANMAVELEPGNLDALSNMGLIYRKLDRADEAEKSFRRALAVDPGYAAAHYNLALLYEQTGQLSQAASHYRSFLSGGGGSEQLNSKVRARLQELSGAAIPSGN